MNITSEGVGTSTPDPFGEGAPSQATATGAGFVVDDQGHIVTAAHVVDGASQITIRFSDGTDRAATLLGKDDATDIAVLKVDPSGLTLHPLSLGSRRAEGRRRARRDRQPVRVCLEPAHRDRLRPRPYDRGPERLHRGARSPDGRGAQPGQLAAPPGRAGPRVGVADQIATGGTEQSAGVGFAVPIDLVADEIDLLAAGKTVEHAYLGVSTGDTAGTAGAAVGDVVQGGPAATAGLRAGDIVTAIHGSARWRGAPTSSPPSRRRSRATRSP